MPTAIPVEVKERPILFSGSMVRAILEGRKTQTRRVLKPQPQMRRNGMVHWEKIGCAEGGGTVEGFIEFVTPHCPYGVPGDRLWVRETHYVWKAGYQDGSGREISYRATTPDAPCTWTPSIFMPRWASRLTLEIVKVRVERVQDITDEDAKAEGVYVGSLGPEATSGYYGPRNAYKHLWDSINAKRGYGWDKNPWVWVVEFKTTSPQEITR